MRYGTKLGITAGGLIGLGLYLRDALKGQDARDRADAEQRLAFEAAAVAMVARQAALDAAARKASQPQDSPTAPKRGHVRPLPAEPEPPPPPPTPILRELTDSPLYPVTGRRYFVTATMAWGTGWLASPSAVEGQARDHGFTEVGVSQVKPAGWPGRKSGSYYVSGRYAGGPAPLSRSYPVVDITEVWEEVV